MADLTPKTAKGDMKLYIRCKDIESIRGFKRVAADFNSYEDLVKWINKNYSTFTKIVPPYPVHGGVL
jgi:hypothetical protein